MAQQKQAAEASAAALHPHGEQDAPGPQPIHFERLLRRVHQMPPWQKGLLVLAVLSLPYVLASLESVRSILINRETWRAVFFPTVSVLYMAAAAPWIWRVEKQVAEGLRPLVQVEPSAFELLVHKSWWRSSPGEWGAFGIGLLVAALLFFSQPSPELRYWSMRYWVATTFIMYGTLAWLIYAAMGSARLTALLHRHVVHEDPFELAPFEPVGRQGLTLAMIFVGAITVSLLFIYTPTLFSEWQSIAIYSILVLATMLIFFTAMWPAHRVLLRVKDEKLAGVRRLIGQTFRTLETLAADGADTRQAAAEVQAWLVLEQRLKQARTWPYDTETLRALTLSVLTPLFVAIARVVGIYLTEGHF